jgi:hypothetical protein
MEVGTTWDDNITRAKAGPDARADSIYSINLLKARTFALSESTRFILTGTLGGERFETYPGMGQLNAGLEGVYQYRNSSEFSDATWALFGRLSVMKFQSNLRDGSRAALGVSVSQPLTDRISAFGAATLNRRKANSAVFTTADTSLRMNLDYALHSGATLYFGTEYRVGDMVSTGQATLESVTITKVFVPDDAYPGLPFFSYQFAGSTVLATLGYNVGLSRKSSLDVSWRWIEATPTQRPSWATSPRSYIANQWGASYLLRF